MQSLILTSAPFLLLTNKSVPTLGTTGMDTCLATDMCPVRWDASFMETITTLWSHQPVYLPIEKLEERLDGAMPCHNYNVSWIIFQSRACSNQLQVKANILYIPFRVTGMHQLVVGNSQELNLLRIYEDKSSIISTNPHKAPSYTDLPKYISPKHDVFHHFLLIVKCLYCTQS